MGLMFLANALAYSGEPGLVPMLGMLAAGAAAGAAYFGQQLFNAYDSLVGEIPADDRAQGVPTAGMLRASAETVFRRGQFFQVGSIMLALTSGLFAVVAA